MYIYIHIWLSIACKLYAPFIFKSKELPLTFFFVLSLEYWIRSIFTFGLRRRFRIALDVYLKDKLYFPFVWQCLWLSAVVFQALRWIVIFAVFQTRFSSQVSFLDIIVNTLKHMLSLFVMLVVRAEICIKLLYSWIIFNLTAWHLISLSLPWIGLK